MRCKEFVASSLPLVAIASQAHADNLKIRSPIVEFGELEFEHFGQTTFDKPKKVSATIRLTAMKSSMACCLG